MSEVEKPHYTYHKLNFDDPRYSTYHEQRRSTQLNEHREIFGSEIIEHLNHPHEERAESENREILEELINNSRENLKDLTFKSFGPRYVFHFLTPYPSDPLFLPYDVAFQRMVEKQREIDWPLGEGEEAVESIRTLLDDEKVLTNDRYINLLMRHRKLVEQRQEAFAHHIPQLKHWFRTSLDERISQGLIPPISPQLITDRLSTDVILSDALTTLPSNGRILRSGLILLNEHLPSSEIRSTFTHEGVHALSGQTVYHVHKGSPMIESKDYYAASRTGLNFHTNHFRWLDEAVTEDIAQLVADPDGEDDGTYNEERQLLKELLSRGNQDELRWLLYQAYFENYDLSLSPEQRIPHWKQFYAAINSLYGSGFLTKLDAMYQAGEINSALHLMRTNWEPILKYPVKRKKKK